MDDVIRQKPKSYINLFKFFALYDKMREILSKIWWDFNGLRFSSERIFCRNIFRYYID